MTSHPLRILAAVALLTVSACGSDGGSGTAESASKADAPVSNEAEGTSSGPASVTLTVDGETYTFVDADGDDEAQYCKPFFGKTLQAQLLLDGTETEDQFGTQYTLDFFLPTPDLAASDQADDNAAQIRVFLPGDSAAEMYSAGVTPAVAQGTTDSGEPIDLTAEISGKSGSAKGDVTFARMSDGKTFEGTLEANC